MVKINNSFIKKISQSEIALFVFLIMALGNLLTFLDNNDLGGIMLFFIIGFLTMMKTKNMVIVLGLTMILTNITILFLKSLNLNLNSAIGQEGLTNKKKKNKKKVNDKVSIIQKQVDRDTINSVKNLTKSTTSEDNLKDAQEALSKLEPLMSRAENLMKMYSNMGGPPLMQGIMGKKE